MTPTRQTVETRIASLPITESDREEALDYVHMGEELVEDVLAIVHFFTDHLAPTLRHTH
jgi:hypothetical protein